MSCMGLMGKIDRITMWKAMQPFHSTWQASKKANVRQTSGDTIGKNMEQCVSLSSYRNTLHPEKATHLGKRRVPRSGDRRTSEQVLWGHAFNTEPFACRAESLACKILSGHDHAMCYDEMSQLMTSKKNKITNIQHLVIKDWGMSALLCNLFRFCVNALNCV